MVIYALAKLKKDFEYSIYGDGKERKKLERLVKKFNLEDKIKFYNKIEHDLIWEKLDNNDIFILPSKDETFGLCYIEAMARGLITIAKKNESMDNIIKNNYNGYLINNCDEIKNILDNLTMIKKQEIIKNTLIKIKNLEKEQVIQNYIKTISKIAKQNII